MDVEYPFATELSRRQLLYRLPTAPAPRRLLLVADRDDPHDLAHGWGGPVTAWTRAQVQAAGAGVRFDAVALPGVLGARTATPGTADLLAAVQRLLVPGGVVVGHVDHLLALRRLATPGGLARLVGAIASPGVVGTAAACTRALQRAGFVQPQCYYVQPSLSAPMGLIPCDRAAARAQFLRAVWSAQDQYSRPAFAARLLVATLGLGGLQQQELFFWATKPC